MLAFSLGGCAGPAGQDVTESSFQNISAEADEKGEDIIALLDTRSFKATLPVEGKTADELRSLIDEGKIDWTLSRDEGAQDPEHFPYQYLGGRLSEWSTIPTEIQEEKPFFTNIDQRVVEQDGKAAVELTFDNELFYGYDGVDDRDSRLVRNSFLDYTGAYELACVVDGQEASSVTVEVRPYDMYATQAEIYEELPRLVEQAKENGMFARIEQIGESAEGRPIQAVFVAKSEADLNDYQALAERAETEPAAVRADIESGAIEYKVPIMYSNIHSDEIVGSDACMEFLRLLAAGEPVPYRTIASLTDAGEQRLAEEMEADGTVWSELYAENATGVGYIQGDGVFNPTDKREKTNNNAGVDMRDRTTNIAEGEFASYYNLEDRTLDVKAALDDAFFIIVPAENPDGRTYNTRTNGNGFDPNRDNTYQTQPETTAMAGLIAQWNPLSFHEIHGYYPQFQIEPCSPAHEPNVEYDLLADTSVAQGEAFGSAAISNNESINSFQTPARDYLKRQEDGSVFWRYPFDDVSTSYTPQYSMLHGTNAFTVELPYGSQDAVEATMYGMVGNAQFVIDNKQDMYFNQLEGYQRGIDNEDADSVRPYYVSQKDEIGAEADVFRPRFEENGKFFPEYYVIPMGDESQSDRAAAAEMVEYLLHNDVKVSQLATDVEVAGTSYKSGDIVIDMHQAKRNMANAALYDNMVISTWSDLFSEPLTNFSALRGFDMDVIATEGAIDKAALQAVETAPAPASSVTGAGKAAVISNNGLDAVNAVNDLLASGVSVGLVTEGASAGDYVVAEEDLAKVRDEYVLTAVLTDDVPASSVIKQDLKVYVPGAAAEFMTDEDENPFGVSNYTNRRTNSYNWDLFALGQQMGFTLVDSADEADVIVGNRSLSEDEAALVAAGKPYVGYSRNALESAAEIVPGLAYNDEAEGSYDALTHVVFPEPSIVTATYAGEGDDIMYGHGGSFITEVPEGARVIVKTTSDYPIEGFMSADHIAKYQDSIQAIDLGENGLHMTLFANSLTNKAHQTDDYRYLTAALYSKVLGDSLTL